MARKIQIAIQGGGARLAALLAAGAALKELERQEKIEITRVAGTSAGAIAALLLAHRSVSIDQLRNNLKKKTLREIKHIFPTITLCSVLWALLRGGPILDIKRFRNFLYDTLKEVDVDTGETLKSFEEEARPVFFVAANIQTAHEPKYDSNRRLDDLVADSCALPYIFRASLECPIVDGGIFDNLPAARLVGSEDNFGKVIAISFKDSTAAPRSSSNLISFSQSLVHSMIESKTRQAKELVGAENICQIDTDLKTFDFARFISSLDDHYDKIKAETTNWLERWLQTPLKSGLDRVRFGAESQGEELRSLHNRVKDLYNLLKPRDKVIATLLRMEVNAYSLLDQDDTRSKAPDEIRMTYHIRPCNENSIRAMKLHVLQTNAPLREHRWEVLTSTNEKVTFVPLPVVDTQQAERGTVLIFEPPLMCNTNNPYYVVKTLQTAEGFMAPLKEYGKDHLGWASTKLFDANRVEIILYAPSAINLDQSPLDGFKDYEAVNGNVYQPAGVDVPPGFRPFGWAGGPIRGNQLMAVCYTRANLGDR